MGGLGFRVLFFLFFLGGGGVLGLGFRVLLCFGQFWV